jgi:hypothetical protein
MTITALPQAPRYDDAIDLNRYPIHDPAHAGYQALVQGCRDQLRDRGVAQLDGFLTPAAVTEMVALASQLAAQAWASDQTHTATTTLPSRTSCTVARMASSGCPPAPARSRFSAASTPCTGSPRSAGRAPGSTPY